MLSAEELEEEAFFKCHFCDVSFVSLPSIVKHKNLYCALRNKLPRSATVTSSSALDDFTTGEMSPEKEMSAGGQSSDLDVVGVSDESSRSSDVSRASVEAMMSIEDVAEYLCKKIDAVRNLAALTEVKSCAKRKMEEEEKELKEESSSIEGYQKCQKSLKQS